MSQEMGFLSAKLIIEFDDKNNSHFHALKLSLSKVVSTMNNEILRIYKNYIKDANFWEKVEKAQAKTAPSMPDNLKQVLKETMQLGKDESGKTNTKLLRLSIIRRKEEALLNDENETLAMMDIMEHMVRFLLENNAELPSDSDSEQTSYRRVVFILLDILLEKKNIELTEEWQNNM